MLSKKLAAVDKTRCVACGVCENTCPLGAVKVRCGCYAAVEAERCVGCGKCAKICPAKAISMQNKLPVIDRKACIHCFCCQEFCPKGAMEVRRAAIARLLNR